MGIVWETIREQIARGLKIAENFFDRYAFGFAYLVEDVAK
jgi:hypothetical protein